MDHSITFESFGVSIELQSDRKIDLVLLRSLLPCLEEGSLKEEPDATLSLVTEPEAGRGLFFEGERVAEVIGLESSQLQGVASKLQLLIALNAAPRYLFLHAGAVALGGKAVLFPGRTHSGKSTLTRAFLDAGARYLTDDCAVVGEDGRVHPYPVPLKLRTEANSGERPEGSYSVESEPCEIALVISTVYSEGAVWNPREQEKGELVWSMLDHLFWPEIVRKHPEETLGRLKLVAERSLLLQGPRGEAGEVVEDVLARL
ncbi:MAG: hypothetical protein IPM63_03160 [Acidobacteriota bacterium]|nr:MAG: hypothetical protein IPM63_03160 [Acidobacteriota bacterium]